MSLWQTMPSSPTSIAVESKGSELDRSKPYVPNVETSSQLEATTRTIDATPLPLKKKRGVKLGKTPTTSEPKDPEEMENRGSVAALAKILYPMRNRKKPPLTLVNEGGGDCDSLQDFTASSSKRYRGWITDKKPQPKESTESCVASRTRKKMERPDLGTTPVKSCRLSG